MLDIYEPLLFLLLKVLCILHFALIGCYRNSMLWSVSSHVLEASDSFSILGELVAEDRVQSVVFSIWKK